MGTNLHHIGGEEEQDEIWENNPGPKSHGGSRTRASVPRCSDIEVSLLCKPVGQEAFQDMNLTSRHLERGAASHWNPARQFIHTKHLVLPGPTVVRLSLLNITGN